MVLTHFQVLHYAILCMEGVYFKILYTFLGAGQGLGASFIAPAGHRRMVLPLWNFVNIHTPSAADPRHQSEGAPPTGRSMPACF